VVKYEYMRLIVDLFDVGLVYRKGNQRDKGDADGSDVVPGRGLKVVYAEFDAFPVGKWALDGYAAGSPE
jgi:hypothetical protein